MRLRSTPHETTETSTDGTDADYYVLGDDHLGVEVARGLGAAGHAVTLVGGADVDDVPSLQGDPSAVDVLCDSGMSETSTVVVATSDDGRNLLVAQLVSTRFDVADVFVVVHTPDRFDLVAEAGHRPICATTVLADAVVTDVRPRLSEADAT
ncbi:NAD-binding protein [Haloplanus halophilus]|uniref:NAD-binding protein n=1 Tax=Haloplanus halophilus TaxID=2949993 RepID=UPI00203F8870|nr:NAD-binding protein [Haloplanus sp. GDY1]